MVYLKVGNPGVKNPTVKELAEGRAGIAMIMLYSFCKSTQPLVRCSSRLTSSLEFRR